MYGPRFPHKILDTKFGTSRNPRHQKGRAILVVLWPHGAKIIIFGAEQKQLEMQYVRRRQLSRILTPILYAVQ